MRDLRLVAVSEDGSALVLTDDAGTEHRLPLDDALRAAARQDRTHQGGLEGGAAVELRPREIQSRIRAGQSAEDVAAGTGVSIERIRRYEGPVLAEREHVARQAQTATVRRTGNAEGPAPRLGELVSTRLEPAGIDVAALSWDAWRREDNRWTLRLTYPLRGRERAALWVYDPQRRVVLPQDGDAHAFVDGTDPEQDTTAPTPSPAELPRVRRLTSVPREVDAGAAEPDHEAPEHEEPEHEAPDHADAVPADAGQGEPATVGRVHPSMADAAPVQHEDAARTARSQGPQPPPGAVPLPLEDLEGIADPVRPDQAAAPAVPPAPALPPGDEADARDDDDAGRAAAARDESTAPRHAAAAPRRPRAGRRASVPSWDDIVFGTRKGD